MHTPSLAVSAGDARTERKRQKAKNSGSFLSTALVTAQPELLVSKNIYKFFNTIPLEGT